MTMTSSNLAGMNGSVAWMEVLLFEKHQPAAKLASKYNVKNRCSAKQTIPEKLSCLRAGFYDDTFANLGP